MRSLFPITKFLIFLLTWGSHSQLYYKEAVVAVVMWFIFFYVRRSKPLMMLLAFLRHPLPSGAESSCILGKQVPLRYSRSSSKWCTPNCQAHTLPLNKNYFTDSCHSLFAPSPSFESLFLFPYVYPSSCKLDVCISSSFLWALFYHDSLYIFWLSWPGWLSSYLTTLPKHISSKCSPLGCDWLCFLSSSHRSDSFCSSSKLQF